MEVLVFEPKSVGHFLGFAMKAARAFAELGAEVTLAVPRRAEGGEQAAVKLADAPERVRVDYCLDAPDGYRQWRNGRVEADRLAEQLVRRRPDHLVVPSGDFLVCGLLCRPRARARVAGYAGDLVLHNCAPAYPRIGVRNRALRVTDRLAVSLAPRRLRLHTVDPFALSKEAWGPVPLGKRRVEWLPHFLDYEPVEIDQAAARRELGLPEAGRVLGSIGDLGTRKGTELLIRSFARSGPPEGVVLTLQGKLSRSAKAVLAEHAPLVASGRIIANDRFVSDREFELFFAAIDAFWAGFPNQIGFSSTLLHAAVAERPILGSDYGFVGWFVQQHGLGRTFAAEAGPMSEAIAWFGNAADWRPSPEGVRSVREQYCDQRFAEALTARYREATGSPDRPAVPPVVPAAGARR